jgi:hypothetical protein
MYLSSLSDRLRACCRVLHKRLRHACALVDTVLGNHCKLAVSHHVDSSQASERRERRCALAEGRAAVEVWSMSADGFGRFTAAVPPPLSIGTVRLVGGRMVKGFLVEAESVKDARDISSFGGWRNYLAKGGQ